MFGWLSAEAAKASRWNRSRAAGSFSISGGRNFSATWRCSLRSSASYTTPIPPPPSCERLRKCEVVLPIMRSLSGVKFTAEFVEEIEDEVDLVHRRGLSCARDLQYGEALAVGV